MMEPKNNRNSRRVTGVLFAVYFAVLSWIILFKMSFDIDLLKNMDYRNINLIPFAGSAIVNGRVDISEIVLNIIAFVPFGVYMSMLLENARFLKKAVPVFMASLLYEVLQYIFAIGGSDITDLIDNTLGGIIGIGIYHVLSGILGERTGKLLNILAVIGTLLALCLLAVLITANL